MAMFINEYSLRANETAIYQQRVETRLEALAYTALGLTGEAGEFAEKVKKYIRDGTFDRDLMLKELGDVLWYINAAARELDSSLEEVAKINLNKLFARKDAGTLNGSGDTR